MKIKPAEFLHGTLRLPGDKSISHRAAMLAAMADGETIITNFAESEDCASTLNCLARLGVEIRRENEIVRITGVGKKGFRRLLDPLDCGNSGTTARLLAGILAGQSFESVLIGDESLSKRPMRRIIEPLAQMGAKIESQNDCLPLQISGANSLKAIKYELNVASAQVKSCVLLAGLNADGATIVRSPPTERREPSSRNHTELMLRYLGADLSENFVETSGKFVQEITIDGNSKLTAGNLNVPSDVSSAAFFLVAAACLKDSELVLENVGLNPTRRAVVDVLKNFGAPIEILDEREICNETIGDLRIRGKKNLASQTNSNIIEGDIIANLIDEIPILAIFGTQLEGGLEIRGAGELRVKESDRIKAIVTNLRLMNAEIEEFSDGFRVERSNLKGARLDSFGDHRIAMAFAVAGLLAKGETEIADAKSAAVSFPGFFEVLAKVAKQK